MVFRKIMAQEPIFEDVRNKHEKVYNDFLKFAEELSFKKEATKKKSGKAASYARYLVRLVILYEEIFNKEIIDLDTYVALHQLEELENLPGFKKYNQDEGRFPNATLGCYKLYIVAKHMAQEEQTDSKLNYSLNNSDTIKNEDAIIKNDNDLVKGPRKRAQLISNKNGTGYPRNIVESIEAKKKSAYKCEIDPSHETFINSKDNNPYIEAHHLIPMAAQGCFENTIDFADNIVTLCPNCHRKIHYGLPNEREEMIEVLYIKREKLYSQYGIRVDKQMLMNFYGINKID